MSQLLKSLRSLEGWATHAYFPRHFPSVARLRLWTHLGSGHRWLLTYSHTHTHPLSFTQLCKCTARDWTGRRNTASDWKRWWYGDFFFFLFSLFFVRSCSFTHRKQGLKSDSVLIEHAVRSRTSVNTQNVFLLWMLIINFWFIIIFILPLDSY